jgi:hypothetical protein
MWPLGQLIRLVAADAQDPGRLFQGEKIRSVRQDHDTLPTIDANLYRP